MRVVEKESGSRHFLFENFLANYNYQPSFSQMLRIFEYFGEFLGTAKLYSDTVGNCVVSELARTGTELIISDI